MAKKHGRVTKPDGTNRKLDVMKLLMSKTKTSRVSVARPPEAASAHRYVDPLQPAMNGLADAFDAVRREMSLAVGVAHDLQMIMLGETLAALDKAESLLDKCMNSGDRRSGHGPHPRTKPSYAANSED